MKKDKKKILSWVWRTLLGVCLTPIVLFLLLVLALCIPTVQKWAVDKAADILSDEMGMNVTVGSVQLRTPIDITLGDVLALTDSIPADTILYTERLDVRVKVRPLLDKRAEVDCIQLRNVNLNTSDLIEDVIIEGTADDLYLDAHDVDIKAELANITNLRLSDANLTLTIPDSVPEDTTVSEPVNWIIRLQDAHLHNVALDVNVHPITDSIAVHTHFGDASLKGTIDLAKETYRFTNFKTDGSHLAYNDLVSISDVTMALDSFEYKGVTSDMYVSIGNVAGKEKNGFNIQQLRGTLLLDSTSLSIPQAYLLTDDSEANITYRMDFTAFDDDHPGTFNFSTNSQLGKSDILTAAKMYDRDLAKTVNSYLSIRPTIVNATVNGNLQNLDIPTFFANIDGVGTAKGSLNLAGDVLRCDVDTRLSGGSIASIPLPQGNAKVKGTYHTGNGKYDAHVVADIQRYQYDSFNLSNSKIDVVLHNYDINGACEIDNKQMALSLDIDGTHKDGRLQGMMYLDLIRADLLSMGLVEDSVTLCTNGNMEFDTNLSNVFDVDAFVDHSTIMMPNDTLETDEFDLQARTTRDSTYVNLATGDLTFLLEMPLNLFKASDQLLTLGNEAMKQVKTRTTNLEQLKAYLPEAKIYATAGNSNPVATILKAMGIRFDTFATDIALSPVEGISGNGHIHSLRVDTIKVDTAFFDIHQDSTLIAFDCGVKCGRQFGVVDAFSARIDGYLSAQKMQAHLLYFDSKGQKGIDIGVKGETNDSSLRVHVFPNNPILAYKHFKINGENFIEHRYGKPYLADVQLISTDDDCEVSIAALESDEGRQKALFSIEDLDLTQMLRVLPFLPDMNGMLSVDLAYQEKEGSFWIDGMGSINNFFYEGMKVGNVGSMFTYEPLGLTRHSLEADLSFDGDDVLKLDGIYDTQGDGLLNADLNLLDIPMKMFSAFVPDQFAQLSGNMGGDITVSGPTDRLTFNGDLEPKNLHLLAPQYSVDLRMADDTISIADSKICFEKIPVYGVGDDPLTLDGSVDLSNMDVIPMNLTLQGRNFQLVNSKRTSKSVLFGQVYGDIFTRISGNTNDINVRGFINVSSKTNMTYLMTETVLSQGDRLDDIVTFVDFSLPEDSATISQNTKSITGVDLLLKLNIDEGARVRCEFSADRQSYVNVRMGGSLDITYTPQGVLSTQGRLTANEGEMKYTLPIIPLKTFNIQSGSYIEFNGDTFNPVLNIAAVERTKAAVTTEDGASKSVAFDVGMKVTQTLNDMGLMFTIEAPEDAIVQHDLDSYTEDEKNKLAVALLATGMYVSSTNTSSLTANNALSSFLQAEINNITSRALNSIVDVSLGIDQTTYANGTTGTDYSFKFSKRFFSDRLSVSIGGRVSDNKTVNQQTDIGSFIDNVSLEWRLDQSATRYIRLFHGKDCDNLIEGELEKNGGGIVLRKKMDSLSELFIFKKKKRKEGEDEKRP